MRLPPNADPKAATESMRKKLTENIPYNCKVTFKSREYQGWHMKEMQPWLKESVIKSGQEFFEGRDGSTFGCGGGIPLLNELERMYPETQIIAMGVVGPNANIHAPNEGINLPYAKKLTCSLSHMIAAVGQQK